MFSVQDHTGVYSSAIITSMRVLSLSKQDIYRGKADYRIETIGLFLGISIVVATGCNWISLLRWLIYLDPCRWNWRSLTITW